MIIIGGQKFLSASEFARVVGVNRSTISRWLKKGYLRGYKHFGRWFINEDEISVYFRFKEVLNE